MRYENYKSDLRLAVTLELGGVSIGVPDHDFALVFRTYGGRSYKCQHSGGMWVNCKAENNKVICFLDNHKLPPGVLHVEYFDYAPDADFPDGNQLKVVPQELDVELVVGLGDDATEIDVDVAVDIEGAISDARAAALRANAVSADLEAKRASDYWRGATGETGATGATGVGITSVTQTTTSHVSEGENVVTVTLSNGQTATFSVFNGEAGQGGGEQSDWNESDNTKQSYIKNKPTIPAAQIQSDWNQSTATALDYIKNKPTIPAAQVNVDWNAESGVAQILNKPTIPDVSGKADKRTLEVVTHPSFSGYALTVNLGGSFSLNLASLVESVGGSSSDLAELQVMINWQIANGGAQATYNLTYSAYTVYMSLMADEDFYDAAPVEVTKTAITTSDILSQVLSPNKYYDFGTCIAISLSYPTKMGLVAGYEVEISGTSSDSEDFMARVEVYTDDEEDIAAIQAMLDAQEDNSGAATTYEFTTSALNAINSVCTDIDIAGMETPPYVDNEHAVATQVAHSVPDRERTDEFLFTFTCSSLWSNPPKLPKGMMMADGRDWSEAAEGVKFQCSIQDDICSYLTITPSN